MQTMQFYWGKAIRGEWSYTRSIDKVCDRLFRHKTANEEYKQIQYALLVNEKKRMIV